MSIRLDPDTGLKIFNTRAASTMGDVVGRGYSITRDESLKTLPPQPPGAVFNAALSVEDVRDRARCVAPIASSCVCPASVPTLIHWSENIVAADTGTCRIWSLVTLSE